MAPPSSLKVHKTCVPSLFSSFLETSNQHSCFNITRVSIKCIFNVLSYHKLCSQKGHLTSAIYYHSLRPLHPRARQFTSVLNLQHFSFQKLYLAKILNSISWRFLGSDPPKRVCSNCPETAHCQIKSMKRLDKFPWCSHWIVILKTKSWKPNWVPNPALLLRHC